jgi:hypothetical protein
MPIPYLLCDVGHCYSLTRVVISVREPKMLTIKNAENSHKVVVIDHNENKPLASIMPGQQWRGEPRLLILPKTGHVHLSIEPE